MSGAELSSAETAAPNRRRRNVPDPCFNHRLKQNSHTLCSVDQRLRMKDVQNGSRWFQISTCNIPGDIGHKKYQEISSDCTEFVIATLGQLLWKFDPLQFTK